MMLGVTESHFWDSTPNELQPYVKMDELRMERLDALMWQMGAYVADAVISSVDKVLNGRKSKANYAKEPFMQSQKKAKEQNSDALNFARFAEWATVYNQTFFKDRQGTD